MFKIAKSAILHLIIYLIFDVFVISNVGVEEPGHVNPTEEWGFGEASNGDGMDEWNGQPKIGFLPFKELSTKQGIVHFEAAIEGQDDACIRLGDPET